MGEKTLGLMSRAEIEEAVRVKYNDVAKNPYGLFNFPVGRAFALKVGYPADVLSKLHESLVESFTGANNPQPHVNLKEGDVVLDLGCGAGLDIYFYAKAVGSSGKVYGLDFSPDMAGKARENMRAVGIDNVEIICSPAHEVPLEDGSVDVVTSNGIYNLSTEKEKTMKEAYRVLKPGGRTVFSEIVLSEPLPEEIRKNVTDYFRCIGGALPEKDLLSLMERTGFTNIEVISKARNARTSHRLAICANIRAFKQA